MKRIQCFKILNIALIIAVIIFCPFLTINNHVYNIIELIKYVKNIGFFALILLLIIDFIYLLISIFFIKNKHNYYAAIIFSILAIILYSIIPRLIPYFCRLDYSSIDFNIGMLFFIALFILFILFFLNKIFSLFVFSIRDIVEMAFAVGFAIVLDLAFLKIRIGATGGSISFSSLPLIVFAIRKGFGKAFMASGIVFGFLSCLIDGYGLQMFPLDYFLGFGSIAVVGLFRNKIMSKNIKVSYLFTIVSIICFGVLRLGVATLSGILFYNLNFVQSLIYQCSYIPLSSAICLGVVMLFLPFLRKINIRYK